MEPTCSASNSSGTVPWKTKVWRETLRRFESVLRPQQTTNLSSMLHVDDINLKSMMLMLCCYVYCVCASVPETSDTSNIGLLPAGRSGARRGERREGCEGRGGLRISAGNNGNIYIHGYIIYIYIFIYI